MAIYFSRLASKQTDHEKQSPGSARSEQSLKRHCKVSFTAQSRPAPARSRRLPLALGRLVSIRGIVWKQPTETTVEKFAGETFAPAFIPRTRAIACVFGHSETFLVRNVSFFVTGAIL